MLNLSPVLKHPTFQKLDQELEAVFANAPHLPKKVVDVLVKIAPYMMLVSGLFMITGGLQSIFGANSFYRMMDLWMNTPPFYFYLIGLLQIVAGALSIIAYQPLRSRLLEGWQIMFILTWLSLLMNLVSVGFFRDGLFGLLLSLLLSLYLIYELRPAYVGADKLKKVQTLKRKKK